MDNVFSFQNRRRYPRINFDTPVTYQIKGETKINYTVIRDLSEGGTELILEFSLKAKSVAIRARAKVVWMQKFPYAERYRAGLEFGEMEPLQRVNLKRFINNEPLLFYY